MKYLLSLILLVSTGYAQSLPQQYAELSPEIQQQYDRLTLKVKPHIEPLEIKVRALASAKNLPPDKRLAQLEVFRSSLDTWIGQSVQRYAVLLPLLYGVDAARETVAKELPLLVPYKDQQIQSQFDITSAQPYAYGAGNATLITGIVRRGAFKVGDKVMVYFKQGGPQITSIWEEVSSLSGSSFLLRDEISAERFIGGAAMFIPQN